MKFPHRPLACSFSKNSGQKNIHSTFHQIRLLCNIKKMLTLPFYKLESWNLIKTINFWTQKHLLRRSNSFAESSKAAGVDTYRWFHGFFCLVWYHFIYHSVLSSWQAQFFESLVIVNKNLKAENNSVNFHLWVDRHSEHIHCRDFLRTQSWNLK